MKLVDILFNRKFRWVEVKYFSPTDSRNILPSGHPIAKGGFIKECADNANKFISGDCQYGVRSSGEVIEAIHPNQYGLADYRGGVIVFSTDVNAMDVNSGAIRNWLTKKFTTLRNRLFGKSMVNKVINKFNATQDKKAGEQTVNDFIGAFSVGNFFRGRYVGDNGKVFDEKSLAVEVNGVSSEALIYLAELIATEFQQETVLVKDLNKNKIYLANSERTGNYDLSTVNKKS